MKFEIDLDLEQMAFVHAMSTMIKFENPEVQGQFDSIMDQLLNTEESRPTEGVFIDIDELENE